MRKAGNPICLLLLAACLVVFRLERPLLAAPPAGSADGGKMAAPPAGSADGKMAALRPGPAALLPRTGQIVCYDADGHEIDYAGTGQDCEFQRGRVWPIPRFFVNRDGTVTDRLTGLMWLRDGACLGVETWAGALAAAKAFNADGSRRCGYSGSNHDWRLPAVDELAGLFNAGEAEPADYLNLQGMANVQRGGYWSASTAGTILNAWVVDFGSRRIVTASKIDKNFVLLVRDAAPAVQEEPEDAGAGKDDVAAAPAPPARFLVEDGTVTDLATGLMWLRDLSCLPRSGWAGALARLPAAGTACPGGAAHDDWSLPNLVEMRSLIDHARDFPALWPDAGFLGEADVFWTSTTDPGAPRKAFVVDGNTGETVSRDKRDRLRFMAVRRLPGVVAAPRLEPEEAEGLAVDDDLVLPVSTDLKSEIKWPPPPRFIDNGDGTSLDIITGYIWLTDANCFEKTSWEKADQLLGKFNTSNPRARARLKFDCQGYREHYNDWVLPSINELKELFNPYVEDPVAWLNTQGVTNVQGSGDYLSRTETPYNLYYNYVFNFKKGVVRNYPKTLKFFLWPRRVLPRGEEYTPLLTITVNSIDRAVTLTPDEPLSINVYLHTFGYRFPADFWLWYETPGGERLWLSSLRTWREKETPVYQGALFNLNNYEIFRSDANGLAPGKYTMHFAVDAILNGRLDNLRYEVKNTVTIRDGRAPAKEAAEP